MKRLLNHPERRTPAGWLISLLLAGTILVPVQGIAQATSAPSDDGRRREAPLPESANPAAASDPVATDRTRATGPSTDPTAAVNSDKEDHRRKTREAKRADPAAGARVAAPPPTSDSETTSADLTFNRANPDKRRAALSRETTRKFKSKAKPSMDEALQRLESGDTGRLRELEHRIRILELELLELRGSGAGRRELSKRDESFPRDPMASDVRRNELKLKKASDEKRKEKEGAPSERRSTNEDAQPKLDEELTRANELGALRNRGVGGKRRIMESAVNREIELKALQDRLDLSDPNSRGRNLPGFIRSEDNEVRSSPADPNGRDQIQLSVRVLRAASDGNRLQSVTDVVTRFGEWVALEAANGRLRLPSNDPDREPQLQFRVTRGRIKGLVNVEFRLSQNGAANVVVTKLGQPVRIDVARTNGLSTTVLIEVKVLSSFGTRY